MSRSATGTISNSQIALAKSRSMTEETPEEALRVLRTQIVRTRSGHESFLSQHPERLATASQEVQQYYRTAEAIKQLQEAAVEQRKAQARRRRSKGATKRNRAVGQSAAPAAEMAAMPTRGSPRDQGSRGTPKKENGGGGRTETPRKRPSEAKATPRKK